MSNDATHSDSSRKQGWKERMETTAQARPASGTTWDKTKKLAGFFGAGAGLGQLTHDFIAYHSSDKKPLLELLKETFSKESYSKQAFAKAWKEEIAPELKYSMAGGTIAVAVGVVYLWHKERKSEKASDGPQAPQTQGDSFAEAEIARRASSPAQHQRGA